MWVSRTDGGWWSFNGGTGKQNPTPDATEEVEATRVEVTSQEPGFVSTRH